jgi:DNA-binding transcriptional ArsR family regulator
LVGFDVFNRQVKYETALDQLSSTFAALADPTRRAILARLITGEASVTQLAEPFEMSMPAISKHLKVLERAGLIARGREAQWRPCRLEAAPLKDVANWVEHYRRFWTESFDRLEDYLKQVQEKDRLPAVGTNENSLKRQEAMHVRSEEPQKNRKRKKVRD